MIEVEFKFPVDALSEVRAKFLELGAVPQMQKTQSDEYLNDPLRDFAKSDKALRIRSQDEKFFMTFKGPNLDPDAKIRKEIEIPLESQDVAEQLRDAFLGMDFYSVAKVVKRRETLLLDWQDSKIEICLDEVEEVGGFCELELVVEDQSKMESAKRHLQSLANEVGLRDPIRTSYLELLLRNRGDI